MNYPVIASRAACWTTRQSRRFGRLKALSEVAGVDRDVCVTSAATVRFAHLAMTRGKSYWRLVSLLTCAVIGDWHYRIKGYFKSVQDQVSQPIFPRFFKMKFLTLPHPVLAATLSLCSAAFAFSAEAMPDVEFDFDGSAALNFHEMSHETRGTALVRDIIFSPTGKPVKAYLVSPVKSVGLNAAILYVHWLGEPSTSNRTEFLNEAVSLANRGVISLLVDTMWADPTWYKERVPEDDRDSSIRQVIQLRRAMDLLLAQPNIDTKRIAFVGHDFGAMYGILAGALDRRAKTYVFMACTPHFYDWFLFARQPQDIPAYQQQIAPLDPINFASRLAPASVYFQFANNDQYVSSTQAAALYAAVGPRKQMTTYDTGHELQTPEADFDRLTWLARELALKK